MNNAIDAVVREAFEATMPSDTDVQQRSEHMLRELRLASPMPARRGRRHLIPRMVFAAVGCLAGAATLAIAQPGLGFLFGDDERDPANQVKALAEPDSPVDMSVFNDVSPEAKPDVKLASMLKVAPALRDTWGEPMPTYARKLLSQAGRVYIAGMPTTEGFVCIAFIVWSDVGSTCIEELSLADPASVTAIAHNDRSAVLGLVIDEVTSVTVRTSAGMFERAALGRNAYFWDGAGARAQSLRIELRDGSVIQRSVAAP